MMEINNNMEELYGYVFWHNYLTEMWYAIPRDEYLLFFNGDKENTNGVLASKNINTLIYLINNLEQIPFELE
jgi:hypothetical protein